ncbi:hypothetical protein L873DRAFT_1763601 [Choiromyces venosus 120613-1]|uniref:GmrSD restriction endonucleases N-terminal domain-containing protein n=1 Tax=Choiromyces venosus 120613-1 TaxID=1336337 RepID=A0A3N4JU08_9PEZI|nr:hypothetical protein L873DRAFT_1763601 [Choiromyces venosus 120613-1]
MSSAFDPAAEEETELDFYSDDSFREVSNAPSVYNPGEILGEADWQRRSISDLCRLIGTEYLNINPSYQRDVVWAHERMSKLIQSILANFYIPPVIFNVIKFEEDGKERYRRICIDGKQRLTSIRRFVDGDIPVLDDKNQKWFYVDNSTGKTQKKVLPAGIKARFLQTDILCVEYDSLGPDQEEDLFSRVQLGVPLTPAEKLKASTGPWQSFAADIENTYTNLMKPFHGKRARSFQLVLQIFKQMSYYEEGKLSTFNSGPAALKKFCENTSLLTPEFEAQVKRVFDTYAEIYEQCPETFINHGYKVAAKYSPIEFVAMALLIYTHPERKNISLLSGDIISLRSFVRESRQDLRSNGATWFVFMDWINNIERYRGGFNTVRVGASPVENSVTRRASGRVARRVEDSDDEEPGSASVSAPVADMSNTIVVQPRNPANATTTPMRSLPGVPHIGNLGPGQASSSSGIKSLPPRSARSQLPFTPAFSPADRRQGRSEVDTNRSKKRARVEDDGSGGRRIKEEKFKEPERVGPFTNC